MKQDKNLMNTLSIETQLRHALQAIEELTKENKVLTKQLNKSVVSVSLLTRFMEHIFNCSNSNYVSDIGQPWSSVKFTKEEIQLLEKLQKGIDPE